MSIDYSKYTILVVDDILSNILLLKVVLEQEKFQIITAQNGKDALEIVAKKNVDLILLDIMMPEMNGFEVAKRLKSEEKTASIPILFISALYASDEIIKGLNIGGSDYITKPFNKEELLLRVKHQISLIDAQRVILEQAEELKAVINSRDKLYSVIAHDLRSPISTLKMALSILNIKAREKNLDPEFLKMVNSGEEISEQAFCLLDNLLKWAKSQTGLLEPIFQRYDLEVIVKGVAEVAFSSARIKNINIDLNLEPDVYVSVDTDMMKSTIRNLIFNAIKFSYPNSTININLKKIGGQAVVEVCDSGCGISKENQKLLLNHMARFTTYGTNREEGTGLGLLVSFLFVKQHHGTFSIDSEEGKGSCFSFSIPLLKDSDF